MNIFEMYERKLRNFVLEMKNKKISAYNEKLEWEKYEGIMFLNKEEFRIFIPFLLLLVLFFTFFIMTIIAIWRG